MSDILRPFYATKSTSQLAPQILQGCVEVPVVVEVVEKVISVAFLSPALYM
jgi:hypothetical protein